MYYDSATRLYYDPNTQVDCHIVPCTQIYNLLLVFSIIITVKQACIVIMMLPSRHIYQWTRMGEDIIEFVKIQCDSLLQKSSEYFSAKQHHKHYYHHYSQK